MKAVPPFRHLVVLIVGLLLSCTITAQSYDFTLLHNGGYSFTIAAVSEFDSGTFEPVTQSYGFTLVLPDGITFTIDDLQPSGLNETVTPISGTSVSGLDPTMSDKDLFLITTDTQGNTISAHGNGAVIPLVSLTVNGNPTSGEIRILSNSSTLASHPAISGALDAFFIVDIIDDGTFLFTNEFDQLTGMEAFSFDTLSTQEITLDDMDLTLFPNPTSGVVRVRGRAQLEQIEVFNIAGQQILVQDNNLTEIDLRPFESGVYLVKLQTERSTKTIKLIKN